MSTRGFVLGFVLGLSFAQAAGAQPLGIPPSAQAAAAPKGPVRPMPPDIKALLYFAGLGGALLGAGVSLGIGSAFGGCDRDENCGFNERDAMLTVGVGLAVFSLPFMSAAGTTLLGRSRGYQGRYGHALLGSALGTGLGGLLAYGLARALEPLKAFDQAPATAVGGVVGFLCVPLSSMFAYQLSDRAQLRPSASLTRDRDLTLGLSARF